MASTSAIATYNDLITAAADYMIRTDLATQIQLAITLCEAEFNRSVRNRRMEQRSTTSTIAGQAYLSLPTDFLEVRSIALVQNPRVALQYLTPSQMEHLYAGQYNAQPAAFSIVDDEFRLAPIPGDGTVVEILYYQQIPSLSATNLTNWLLTAHPDIYLYGTLVQMSVIISNTDLGGAVAALYQNSIGSLMSEEKREQWNGSPLSPTTDTWMR